MKEQRKTPTPLKPKTARRLLPPTPSLTPSISYLHEVCQPPSQSCEQTTPPPPRVHESSVFDSELIINVIDIMDDAITFFRANVFFRNFDIKSPTDKLLIYLTFYINVALKRLEGCRTLAEGTKAVINLGLENVPVPGEPGFHFPGLFVIPPSNKEAG
ncbi:actin-related protein 2/3 complex subunit 3-like [Vicia villosa]|uniref:actin-related protein 2/3 complex subunit 3-like n=1 Tax=Vicia villosa TaxID=3911 RepID=UPI00273B33D2|nr:actin-related protein 2/3 complex subunit 3-like [Vicia villosa]